MVLEVQDDEEDCVAIDRWCAVGFVRGGHRSGCSVSACGAVNYSLRLVCVTLRQHAHTQICSSSARVRKLIKHHMMGKLQTYAHSSVLAL